MVYDVYLCLSLICQWKLILHKITFFVQEQRHELSNLDSIQVNFQNDNTYDFDSLNDNSLGIIDGNLEVNQAPNVPVPTLPVCKF